VGVKRELLAVAVLAVAAPLGWGFAIEPASLRSENYPLAIPGWPPSCNGLRIAVLADLHVGSPFNGLDKLDRVIARTEQTHPDLILLAGDYVIARRMLGGIFAPPEAIAASLRKLAAPLGVWSVLGNHDWWFDAPRVRRALSSVGIPVLEDAATRIDGGACRFWLVGISDYWEGKHDVPAALEQVTDAGPVLALTHNPDVFPDVPARVSLTIAAHTHGGQVYIPLIGRPIVPSRYGARYAIGHVVEEGRHLFVSPGLGTSIIPVRFLVPPEISVLIVRSES
jgi:predicted MPP superfamily phosphohydrolase